MRYFLLLVEVLLLASGAFAADPAIDPDVLRAFSNPVTVAAPRLTAIDPDVLSAFSKAKSTTSAKLAPAAVPVYERALGYHTHQCSNGHEWSHSDANRNNKDAHTCPVCGEIDWTPRMSNTRIVTTSTTTAPPASVRAASTITSSPFGDCPDGRCPTPSTRRRTLFR
jgi:hypothetical protein